MPRRKSVQTPSDLEARIKDLREQQRNLRQQLRRIKNSSTEVKKLEEKLSRQLGYAKWTMQEIRELNPAWDEANFSKSVQPRKPARRGPRKQTATE